jgi:hypothetical protein
MFPLQDKKIKTIATVIPTLIDSVSRNRKRISSDAVMDSIETFLKEYNYEGEDLATAKRRVRKDLRQTFGQVKTFPKDKLGDELHFALRFMHLTPQPKAFVFVEEIEEKTTYREFSLNTDLTAEEIQKKLPSKLTSERFVKIMKSGPFFFSHQWYKHLYTQSSRLKNLEKIYAQKR